jgi:uncharacterized protein YbjT (DUF2867 family)
MWNNLSTYGILGDTGQVSPTATLKEDSMTTMVLLAGGTGMLGTRIARHLLDGGAQLRVLVRDAGRRDPKKRVLLDTLTDRGAQIVEGAMDSSATLLDATRDIDVVVSALQGGREVIVDAQVALARAAAANGVRRFLPSDFALDLFRATPGEHLFFDLRREVDEQISALDLQQVNILNGALLDGFVASNGAVDYDDDAGVVTFWGTGEERFEGTSVDDTARIVARVALDPDVPPGKFAVAGQLLSFGDMITAIERHTGRRYERRSRGGPNELRAWMADQRRQGEVVAATMGAYQLYMITGQTSLDNVQNDRYPDVRFHTFEEVLASAAS